MFKSICRSGRGFALGLGLSLLGVGAAVAADTYPTKPIRLVVGLAPGGVGDVTARAVAQKMSKALGQQVVVDNKPGGGQIAAMTTVVKAPADGYTLAIVGSGNASTQLLFKDVPYDMLKDFTSISTLGYFELAVYAKEGAPFTNLQEFVKAARSAPGKLNVGTVNVGSTQNLTAELLKSVTGVNVVVVPYKASADVVAAVMAGDVQVGIDFVPPIVGQVRAKALRVLAFTSGKRFPGMPDVPTAMEAGFPKLEAASWNGIAAPAGTPAPVIEKLNRAIREAVAAPDVEALFRDLGVDARSSTPEEIHEVMRNDIAKWKSVIETAKIERQ